MFFQKLKISVNLPCSDREWRETEHGSASACLPWHGRVIMERTKILVLDEATISVYTATDNLIQKTLRENFSEATVITIVHRITSVLDSDMVLLLNNGQSSTLQNKSLSCLNNLPNPMRSA
jgi:ABC-type cobalamin/Fe3+-siderophores transport system ATPase subunit